MPFVYQKCLEYNREFCLYLWRRYYDILLGWSCLNLPAVAPNCSDPPSGEFGEEVFEKYGMYGDGVSGPNFFCFWTFTKKEFPNN